MVFCTNHQLDTAFYSGTLGPVQRFRFGPVGNQPLIQFAKVQMSKSVKKLPRDSVMDVQIVSASPDEPLGSFLFCRLPHFGA